MTGEESGRAPDGAWRVEQYDQAAAELRRWQADPEYRAEIAAVQGEMSELREA